MLVSFPNKQEGLSSFPLINIKKPGVLYIQVTLYGLKKLYLEIYTCIQTHTHATTIKSKEIGIWKCLEGEKGRGKF